MQTNICFWSYLAQFFLEWEMFQIEFVHKMKTHISRSITFFFRNHAVYEIMWNNMVQLDRPQMTIRRMRITCWIPKATNTLSEYGILLAFPLQQWLHEPASVLRYTYIARLEISELYCCQIYPDVLFFNFTRYKLPLKEGRYGIIYLYLLTWTNIYNFTNR